MILLASERLLGILRELKADKVRAQHELNFSLSLELIYDVAYCWGNLSDSEKYFFIDCLNQDYGEILYKLVKEQVDNERIDLREEFKKRIFPPAIQFESTKESVPNFKKNKIKSIKMSGSANLNQAPKIIYRYINQTRKNWIRFCLVQLDYVLESMTKPSNFGFILLNRESVKDKVIKALEICASNHVDIICLPELSFLKEWLYDVSSMYNNMIIVCGSYYEDGYNVTPIIVKNLIIHPFYRKCVPSIFETSSPTGRGMKTGTCIYIFQTEFGRFSVLTCSDFTEFSEMVCKYETDDGKRIDFIINPCCDHNPSRSQAKASSDCDAYSVDVIQVNKSNSADNKYGRSCVIGREADGVRDILSDEGFRPKEDPKHKLCEANGEEMLMVDLNIRVKPEAGIVLPPRYNGRIRILKKYTYKNDWIINFDRPDQS